MQRRVVVIVGLAALLGAAACGIKSAPRPPLPPQAPPAATGESTSQGDVSRGPLSPSPPPSVIDSGTP